MSDGTQKVRKAADEVADNADGAVKAGKDVAARVSEKGAEVAANVRDAAERASHAARQGYERARDSFRQGRDVARKWESELERPVRERPLLSLLIAAAIGAFLGMLLTSRHRD